MTEVLLWAVFILGALYLAYHERAAPPPDPWIEHPRAPK